MLHRNIQDVFIKHNDLKQNIQNNSDYNMKVSKGADMSCHM